jgi:hypothetical protein
VLFNLGDCLFLIVVSVVAVLVMHVAHRAGWGFVLECAAGMAAAMIAQTLLALLAAPLLGSIESMTPSMALGMISPMVVCALHLAGCDLGGLGLLAIGALTGLAMFLFVAWYARACRRFVRRACAGDGP